MLAWPSITTASSAPVPKSKPAPALPGRAARKSRPAPPTATCPRPSSKATAQLNSTDCEVLAIVKDGVGVPAAKAGDQVEIVLDHTSFYGDSGGQIGDTGWFTSADGNDDHRRNHRLRSARARRARAQGRAQAAILP